MKRARSYRRRYRGSRRGGIGILIPVLIVLCIVAAGALYVINDNMSFTLDGAFFKPAKGEKEPEQVEANLIIEAEEEKTQTPLESEAGSNPPAPIATDKTRAYFIPIGSVKSAELFASELSEVPSDKGINTLVLEVKAEDGTLAFASESPLAQSAEVSGDDEILKSAIASAREAGYRVALYMSCFKDNEAARRNQSYSVRTENKIIWLDAENIRWLSAYSNSAQEYLISSVKKLNSFAPDEIILSNIAFPAVGKTEIIAYDETLGEKREMLKSFIDDVKKAAGEATLSAVYENYNSSRRAESGQEPEDFAAFENIYINERAGSFTLDIKSGKTSFKNTDCNLITISDDISGENFLIK